MVSKKGVSRAEENLNPRSETPALSDLSPIAPIRIFRPNQHMEVGFDVRTRTPLYVLQCVVVHDKQNSDRTKKGRRHFYEEKTLPEAFRSRNGHYHRSGYDRGHLAPAADFYHDESSLHDSYNLINVAPQNQDMNRKIWSKLEKWTRNVARRERDEGSSTQVYAVTGPLWLPNRQVGEKQFEYRYPGLGVPPSILAVPTHFFKVVVVLDDTTIVKLACFVVPNNKGASTRELQDYLVRWTDLETVSGLEFFPGIASDELKAMADCATDPLLPHGQPLLLSNGSPSHKRLAKSKLRHLCEDHSCSTLHKRNKRKSDE